MKQRREAFIAYAYSTYPKVRYRRLFKTLEAAYEIKFIFADEHITNMHIMDKIVSYVRSAEFSLFDISGWNPNVTLELGFAMATSKNWYIALNPTKTELQEVPSDLRGLDRIQYDSLDELGKQVARLLAQRRVPARPQELADPLLRARPPAKRLVELNARVRNSPGAIDRFLRRLRLAKVNVQYMYVVGRTSKHTTFAIGVKNARAANKALGRR
jgi:hypothetical protein